MNLTFRKFSNQDTDDVNRLLNDTSIRRHLPLARSAGTFSAEFVQQWIVQSVSHWQQHGYGTWRIERDNAFIGWGGCQALDSEREFVLVVHRQAMGAGVSLIRRVLEHALREFGEGSMVVVLPVSRPKSRLLRRVGYTEQQHVKIHGCDFVKYRHPCLSLDSLI
ncbi:hypothetical protein AltI4_10430 [Alteromonas sp. I4]|nr:hypothetical protein AltI4_10430 [Alteromonas sp. I4]